MVNHFERGIRHWENGDYELALYCFKDAKYHGEHLQHENPDFREAYLWNLIGICNQLVSTDPAEDEESKIKEALDCFKNAIKLVNEEPIYWRNFALLLYWNRETSRKVLKMAKNAIDESINRFEKIHPIQHKTDIYIIQNYIKKALTRSIDNLKIPEIIKIFSKFDKMLTSTLANLLEMEHEECLDWLISLPDNLGFVISNNEIKINQVKFNENKYLLEDRIITIMKIASSMVLEPNPISY